jgi:hypothetical protein
MTAHQEIPTTQFQTNLGYQWHTGVHLFGSFSLVYCRDNWLESVDSLCQACAYGYQHMKTNDPEKSNLIQLWNFQ